MRAVAVRLVLVFLGLGLCFMPPFGACYHTDGGTCVETRAGDCCATGSSADASSSEDCPDCTDVLASVALPMSRPELSGAIEISPLLAPALSGGLRALCAEIRWTVSRDGPLERSAAAALLSPPLRC